MRDREKRCSECLQLQKEEMESPYVCEGCVDAKLEQSIKSFQKKLVENTQDIDPYYNEFVDDHFEELQ